MNPTDGMTEEQKQYLQGFVSGANLARSASGLPTFAQTLARNGSAPPGPQPAAGSLPSGPEAIHYQAQDRFLAEGKKLCPEEEAKRKKNPLDMWDELRERAEQKQFPKGTDVLLTKFHGLFYVAPNQDSYMCRLRLYAGLVSAAQFRGIADIAEQFGGGYCHVTTRANLQIREIQAENSINVLTALQDHGIVARGTGADNIRNITATPTAGFDTQELIDTRPLARELHYYILNHREMYGLPRKFNVGFDGGGTIAVLEETNDIGFTAVRVVEGKGVPAGVYFRMALGGITGHKDFARDVGVLLRPEECVPAAAAVVRVFIDHGDRTDRKKARMKYVLDRWGLDKYLEEAEKHLPRKLLRFPLDQCEPRAPLVRGAHIGFHPQRQPGLVYVGVVLPVGRMSCDQMRGLARIAERHGSASFRLTVWQNLLIPDIPEDQVEAVKGEIEALGFAWKATQVRTGLVACTGNFGCRFSSSDTKRHALEIADHLDARLELDVPINIHLTGCPNSCAQHYIGDIGLLGTKVAVEDDMVEGYHLFLGGGYGAEQDVGREIYRDVKAEVVPVTIERMLRGYLAARLGPQESFRDFTRRYPTEQLKEMFASQPASEGRPS
ncbi:MAG: NirA family protein [Planctomycetaceae bacterium]|nr:NirA family protein [Planctomycetaceae bacterium]